MNFFKNKNILNNIGFFFIILNLLVFNIVIGSNDKSLPIIPMTVLLFLSIIILILKKIVKKEKIVVKNKIDIAVLGFISLLFLPIIFRTYSSYEDSINFILKYLYVYSNYLLVRNFVDSKKKYNIIIVLTIVFSLIVITFGIDKQHGYYFKNILEKLNLNYEKDERFSSTFGYVNSVTIYITFCILLTLNRIENTKKILCKILYLFYIILGSYVVYVSLSRVVLIILALSLGLYILIKFYLKFKNNKKVIKISVITTFLCSIVCVVFVVSTLKYSKPYSTNDNFKFRKRFEPNKSYNLKFDISVEGGTEEEIDPVMLQMEIQEKIRNDYKKQTDKDSNETYREKYDRYYKELSNKNLKMKIIEVNNYFSEKELGVIELNDIGGISEINVETSDDVYYLKMIFENANSRSITINKCFINGEEYALAYKYLPRVIGRLISSFSYTDDSIVLRKQFYKTAIDISKNHFIIGNGGNAWQNMQKAYQQYSYDAKEAHSYFFELLISYGIIGVISFILIIILLIKDVLKQIISDKESRQRKLLVIIGFCILIGHSLLFDFNMSFIIIMLIVFDYIGLLQFNFDNTISNKNNILNIVDYIVILIFISSFICLLRVDISRYLINDISLKAKVNGYNSSYAINSLKERSKNEIILDDLKKFMKREPYYLQNIVSNMYWNQICKNIENLNKEEIKNNMEFGIKQYKSIEIAEKMNFEFVLNRANIMVNTIKKLEKYDNNYYKNIINELKEIIKNEYKENIVNIEDNKRNYLTEEEMKNVKNNYEILLNSIV